MGQVLGLQVQGPECNPGTHIKVARENRPYKVVPDPQTRAAAHVHPHSNIKHTQYKFLKIVKALKDIYATKTSELDMEDECNQ